jgi:hypothetical protein
MENVGESGKPTQGMLVWSNLVFHRVLEGLLRIVLQMLPVLQCI